MDYWIEKALALNKEIVCLRDGFCCWAYAVNLPDGTIKPKNSFCPHYEIDEGRGSCKIYVNRPIDCILFVMPGTNNICALGAAMKKKFGPDFVMREE
jgi:uncharacterized cysteine cluster protein YcgN (CxxCxxCC family)